ncbi:M28 family metallopeptidase [Rhodococcus sp. NPDC003318]|uniref:M28 family metallopeptidase n=1 Tax=Rhodococcus sp. NPDC003318 TaxID=3364503 RepID=UPI0036A8030D
MTGVEFATLPTQLFDSRAAGDGATRWARLADDVVVWAPADHGVSRVTSRGPASLLDSAPALVTQVGAAFQLAHPEVEVLVDHGRYLVVDAAAVPTPTAQDRVCWRVQPLPQDTVIVDRPATDAGARDPGTAHLLAQLSRPSYEGCLGQLTSPRTRHSFSDGFRDAAAAAGAMLTSFGYTVTQVPVRVGAGRSRNVIAARPGAGAGPRGVIVATAHLDSVNHEDGETGPAPGADDNASGAAGVVELGRVLATRAWHHDLRLILFGGEEQGLFGSSGHVAGLTAAQRRRILAVINMDMVARRNTPEPGVLVEGAPVSRTLVDDLVAAASTWTGLTVSTSLSPFASDHVAFIDAGIPAALTIEDNDTANRDVHSARDVVSTLDPALAMEILRMNLAVLAGYLSRRTP